MSIVQSQSQHAINAESPVPAVPEESYIFYPEDEFVDDGEFIANDEDGEECQDKGMWGMRRGPWMQGRTRGGMWYRPQCFNSMGMRRPFATSQMQMNGGGIWRPQMGGARFGNPWMPNTQQAFFNNMAPPCQPPNFPNTSPQRYYGANPGKPATPLAALNPNINFQQMPPHPNQAFPNPAAYNSSNAQAFWDDAPTGAASNPTQQQQQQPSFQYSGHNSDFFGSNGMIQPQNVFPL